MPLPGALKSLSRSPRVFVSLLITVAVSSSAESVVGTTGPAPRSKCSKSVRIIPKLGDFPKLEFELRRTDPQVNQHGDERDLFILKGSSGAAKQIIDAALNVHIVHKTLSPELVKKALKNWISLVDPLALVFSRQQTDYLLGLDSDKLNLIHKDFMESGQIPLLDVLRQQYFDSVVQLISDQSDSRIFEAVKAASQLDRKSDQTLLSPPSPPSTYPEQLRKMVSILSKRYSAHRANGLGDHDALVVAIRDLNRTLIRPLVTQSDQDLMANSFLRSLDPYSWFENAHQTVKTMYQQRSRIFLGASVKETSRGFEVLEIQDGSPASKARLKVGDVIFKADQFDINGWSNEEFTTFIRKQTENSTIELSVFRSQEKIRLPLTFVSSELPVVVTESVSHSVIDTPTGKLGVIHLSEFSMGVAEQIKSKLIFLENSGVEGLILILSDNPGGFLVEAQDIASLFINRGPIYSSAQGAQVQMVGIALPNGFKFTKPMVVMVNKLSASASEFLAGSLQYHRRAVIVGAESTFGKGTIHEGFASAPWGVAHVSVKWFLTPEVSPEGIGVASDVIVPGPGSALSSHESVRLSSPIPAFAGENPIENFKIEASIPIYKETLEELRRRSQQRVQSDAQLKNNADFGSVDSMDWMAQESYEQIEYRRKIQFEEARRVLEDLIEIVRVNSGRNQAGGNFTVPPE